MSGGLLSDGVAFLEANPQVGCLGALIFDPDGSRQASARRFPTAPLLLMRGVGADRWGAGLAYYRDKMMCDARFEAPTEVDWVTGAFMLISRRAFDAVGGFDPRYRLYYEDVDFCRRLSAAGYSTVLHPGLMAVHDHARDSAKGLGRKAFYWHLASVARFLTQRAPPAARMADVRTSPAIPLSS